MILERSFHGTRDSVPAARHFVLEALPDIPGPTSDALRLMVSELATNCVLHATSSFHIAVQRTASSIRIEVTDSGGGQAQLQSPKDSETHGRGLLIVQALSDDWGVATAAENAGKTVWFCVTVETADSSTAGATTAEQVVTHQPVLQGHRTNARSREARTSDATESTPAPSDARFARAAAVGSPALARAIASRSIKTCPARDVPGRSPRSVRASRVPLRVR